MKGVFLSVVRDWRRVISGLILSVVALSVVADQVYTWTDDNGVRHFSKTAPPPEIQAKAINTQVHNSALVVGDGTMPQVEETRRCPAEELAGLRVRLSRLDRDFNERMAECDSQRRNNTLIGSYAECQRHNRVWLADERVNYQRAIDLCHNR